MPNVIPGGHRHDPGDHVASPSGGLTADAQARTAIDAIRDLLAAAGLMKPA